jgi:predicted alpha/beta-fold hydrolase
MQTIYSAGVNTVEEDIVHYKRRVLLLPDGGIISLDIAEREADKDRDDIATVVICHGLTGGSQES